MADDVTDATDETGDTSSNTDTSTDTSTDAGTGDKVEWPEAWREMMAGDDAKALKKAERYKSPSDVMTALRSMEQRLSSGDMKSALPADATDEQVAAYRKDNGIPETSAGYLENLPDGLVIGDDDKEQVQSYIDRVHGKNADPVVVAESLAWYQELKEQAVTAQVEADKVTKQTFEDALRVEWGEEYRSNVNSVMSFLDTAPTSEDGTPLKDLILEARLGDGTHMGNHPDLLKWFAQLANDANPAGFISPASGLGQIDSVESEIAEIQKTMRTDRAAYNKNEKMQQRYLVLLDAQSKLKAA